MSLRHRPILAAAHLPLGAQPETFWDRSSRWGGAHPECCQPCSYRQVSFPRPVSIHPKRAVSSCTEDLPCLGVGNTLGQAAPDRLVLAVDLPLLPPSLTLGIPHHHLHPALPRLGVLPPSLPRGLAVAPLWPPPPWDAHYEKSRVCMLLQDVELCP